MDTRATVTVIRTRLSSLDTKISELQDNIIELNQFVKTQTDGLEARGERTDDLLVNLFKAYKACGDEEFLTWIKAKEDTYNEGADITPEELMSLADNKYKTLNESGQWMQKSSASKRIVALAAQVLKSMKNGPTNKKPEFKKDHSDKKGGPAKPKTADTKNKGKDKHWAWTLVGPTGGQPMVKDVAGKHFRWCTYHDEKGSGGKWVTHTLVDCKVRQELEAAKLKAAGGKPSDSGAGQMKVAGMVAILPEDDDF